ncbi:hypothetical protein NPIL_174641 [Nephila pilipes]|uniref:Uncharacterized protein n=1 Tax=Nephila pilipes TaxID=299642 RepID=A0A8X6TE77_NEPPI|nr:hypothetical protein NPIL_174641 [Nephila pilipes]
MITWENVQNVHHAYRGMHALTMDLLTTRVVAAWCLPNYTQHEDEHLCLNRRNVRHFADVKVRVQSRYAESGVVTEELGSVPAATIEKLF